MALFYLVYSFNGLFIHNITADSIIGVRGIGNHPSFFQDVDHLLNQSGLRIYGVDFNKHIKFYNYPEVKSSGQITDCLRSVLLLWFFCKYFIAGLFFDT